MEIDKLNKNQIVLLTLLVSFVTSIATGIVTVTLMDQAPVGVTQTVNRVVERTIERVVPGETKTTTVIKEVPILITEEQLIADLVQSASAAVVRVTRGAESLGSAFIVSRDGQVITAAHLLIEPAGSGSRPAVSGDKFNLILEKGEKVEATLVRLNHDADLALLQASKEQLAKLAATAPAAAGAVGTGDDQSALLFRAAEGENRNATSTAAKPLWTAVEIAETETFPGQTVVVIGALADGPISVAGGIISSLVNSAAAGADLTFLKTNAVNENNLGGPVFNTKGKVIGVATAPGSAVAALAVKKLLAS